MICLRCHHPIKYEFAMCGVTCGCVVIRLGYRVPRLWSTDEQLERGVN